MTFPTTFLGAAGGIGFRPPGFDALLFWFAADGSAESRLYSNTAGTTPAIPGGSVAAIRSDEGYLFDQNTAGRRPTRTPDGKGLVFTKGANTSLETVAGSALPAAISSRSAYTMFVACTYAENGTAFGFHSSANNLSVLAWGGTSASHGQFITRANGSLNYAQRDNLTGGARNLLVGRLLDWSGASAIRLNTTLGTTYADNAGGAPAAYSKGRIGADGVSSTSQHCSMTLYELAIYDGAISDAEAAELIAYGQARWGLP